MRFRKEIGEEYEQFKNIHKQYRTKRTRPNQHSLDQEAFKDCKVRIMPDVHAGSGCVIGFTANLGDKVIPNIVESILVVE